MIEQSKHYAIAIVCGAKRGPKDSDLTFSPASLRDFLAAATPPTPQQRPWVGLTDEEMDNFVKAAWGQGVTAADFIRAIEAKLKEKNT